MTTLRRGNDSSDSGLVLEEKASRRRETVSEALPAKDDSLPPHL